MRSLVNFIPRYFISGTVRAEDRPGWILQVAGRVVSGFQDHLLRVMARFVPADLQVQGPP